MSKIKKIPKGYYKATPVQIAAICVATDTLSGMIGTGSSFDESTTRIVKAIDRFLKSNEIEREFD